MVASVFPAPDSPLIMASSRNGSRKKEKLAKNTTKRNEEKIKNERERKHGQSKESKQAKEETMKKKNHHPKKDMKERRPDEYALIMRSFEHKVMGFIGNGINMGWKKIDSRGLVGLQRGRIVQGKELIGIHYDQDGSHIGLGEK